MRVVGLVMMVGVTRVGSVELRMPARAWPGGVCGIGAADGGFCRVPYAVACVWWQFVMVGDGWMAVVL